jgi:hypothetical protein
LEPGVLRRNGIERRDERSNAQLSDFCELKTSLPSNHPNAELSLARAHHVDAREKETDRSDALVTDSVAEYLHHLNNTYHQAESIHLNRSSFIILVSSMSSGRGSSIHVFVKSYDFAIVHGKDMGKVAAKLPTGNPNTPGVMTKQIP